MTGLEQLKEVLKGKKPTEDVRPEKWLGKQVMSQNVAYVNVPTQALIDCCKGKSDPLAEHFLRSVETSRDVVAIKVSDALYIVELAEGKGKPLPQPK